MVHAPDRIARALVETARELVEFGDAATALTLLRAAAEIDPNAEGLGRLRIEVDLRLGPSVDVRPPIEPSTKDHVTEPDTAILSALWLMTSHREAEARELFQRTIIARKAALTKQLELKS